MSPSMKSKSKLKEKASARAGKEQQKASSKISGSTNHGNGIPASAYNPISGTFQTLETSLVDSSALVHDKGQFLKSNDTDEHSSSPQGTVSEYDSVSNNGSCSGESEDPKEKAANSSMRLDTIPGCDNDRREKIRLKNERKHQRQRERRAHELHDRCSGYLMSRKLETLAQKLVSMGFSSERATLALKLNDGKLEESISWLFEEESHTKDTSNLASDLKIDISEELSQISAMEVKYNCSKQEVERVVVAYEGDLQKAESTLKSQKQESPVTQSRSEDSAQNNNSSTISQALPAASVSMLQRGNESDFNYYRAGGADSMFQDPESRNLQSPPNLNHPNELAQKRYGVTASSPSNMLTMAQSMQAFSPFVKMEANHPSALRNEGRMMHQGVGREPVVMMQQHHPQFTNARQNFPTPMNSSPSGTSGWYVNRIPPVENVRSNGRLQLQNHSTGTVSTDRLEQLCQAPYKEYPHAFGQVDSSSSRVGGFYKPMSASSPSHTVPSHSQSQHHGSWSTSASSPSLTVPPSLGLFSAHQSSARTFSPHSNVDWNTGSLVTEFDYTSIDWSLDCPPSSRSGRLWLGVSSLLKNSTVNRMSSSSYMTGLRSSAGMARETSSSSGLRDWTSPFAGKDIFSVPRQFVTSPPL